ncbi:Uncharacterised protein [Mycobacteroides abscessus subsp. abscessus]|nr:Uncharacterised protein [Mycobacteroides abscessus subsp. abscessus]SKT53995.1 Uncharacterised protein [Mycobacteroides abscessus subsp. abscessus]
MAASTTTISPDTEAIKYGPPLANCLSICNSPGNTEPTLHNSTTTTSVSGSNPK